MIWARIEGTQPIPTIAKSSGVASLIDNGIGQYQLVYDRDITQMFSMLATAQSDQQDQPLIVNERSDIERTPRDCHLAIYNVDQCLVDGTVSIGVYG